MNAKAATIAAPPTTAAPMALCDRLALRVLRRLVPSPAALPSPNALPVPSPDGLSVLGEPTLFLRPAPSPSLGERPVVCWPARSPYERLVAFRPAASLDGLLALCLLLAARVGGFR
ncbi:hypothetical protein [Kribbella monticola]|uniref:hypothetical protein n=1 Tax=Kribbella monticola TaxID=2185285 RepID=UPI0013003B36|nr:hypothetical protein [Kribbella monticola]